MGRSLTKNWVQTPKSTDNMNICIYTIHMYSCIYIVPHMDLRIIISVKCSPMFSFFDFHVGVFFLRLAMDSNLQRFHHAPKPIHHVDASGIRQQKKHLGCSENPGCK